MQDAFHMITFSSNFYFKLTHYCLPSFLKSRWCFEKEEEGAKSKEGKTAEKQKEKTWIRKKHTVD